MWIEEEGGRTGCIFIGSLFVKGKKKKERELPGVCREIL